MKARLSIVAALLGALLAALLGPAGCAPGEGWHMAPQAQGRWPVGVFELSLSANGEGDAQLRLQRPGAARALWASADGVAPFGASQVELKADEKRGMVHLDERTRLACRNLRVDAATPRPGGVVLQAQLDCGGARQPLTIDVMAQASEAGQAVELKLQLGPGPANRVQLGAASPADEALWGGGMQASRIDWKGAQLPIVASEQGVGRGSQPISFLADLTNNGAGGKAYSSYAAIAHWISSHGRSLWVDSHALVRLDARAERHIQLAVQAREARIVWREAATPLELIQAHTAEVGRMRALPDWVMSGAVIGLQGGSDAVERKLQKLREAGVPIAALWLQDWVGQRRTSFGRQLWWNWQLDERHYPRFAQQVAQWRAQGMRWLGYVNPFLVELEAGDPRKPLIEEARRKGYLLKAAGGETIMSPITSFSAAHLDLENPAAVAWLKDVLKAQLLKSGASGWMADFAEGRPFEGPDAWAAHNRWPELWARLNRELLEESGLGAEGVVFHRSAWSRSPRDATLFWVGDQLVDWSEEDGLPSSLTGLLSAGLSGMSLNHADIGGYTAIQSPVFRITRSAELLMRWAELAAFTPVMRTHEGNRPEANAQLVDDARSMAHFARQVRLHGCWAQERKRLVQQAARQGLPVNRALALHYPHLPGVWTEAPRQMLIGPDILLAPVLRPGATQVAVRIPEAGWRHLWSGRHATPGTSLWPAPLGEPAVFVREGSAAAMELIGCARGLGSRT